MEYLIIFHKTVIKNFPQTCRSDYWPSSTQTEYKYRSVQTGSVDVPYKGGSIFVGPDHNQTKSYLAKIDTTVSHNYEFKNNYILIATNIPKLLDIISETI